MCRAIIFDLDGTLVDDVDVHLEAWKRAMEELGMPPRKEEIEAYRKAVGKSLRDILEDIYGKIDEEFYKKVRELKNKYFKELIENVKPIIDRSVLEVLKKRYKLAVFTSTNSQTARDLLKAIDVEDLFDVVVTADDVTKAKPDPEGIRVVLDRLGCREAIFIGDTIFDEETAKRAGVKFIHIKEFLRAWKSLL